MAMQSEEYGKTVTTKTFAFTWKHIVALVAGSFILPSLLAFIFMMFVAQAARIEGKAMEPTLKNNDRVMLNKRLPILKRGDIVVFRFPRNREQSFMMRIVGLPDETISIDADGKTLINGSPLEEPYLLPSYNQHPKMLPETLIKSGHYFVMGDNRDSSNDSRSWGQVPKDLIYGKYMFSYWSASE